MDGNKGRHAGKEDEPLVKVEKSELSKEEKLCLRDPGTTSTHNCAVETGDVCTGNNSEKSRKTRRARGSWKLKPVPYTPCMTRKL